jgi:protein phosphatase
LAELPKTPAVEIAFRTDPGRDPDKQVNEDGAAHIEVRLGLLAIVCDGMGGHAGGKEASELAVKTILEVIEAAPEKTSPRDALRVAIEEANRRVWSMPTSEGGYRPGSTVVAVLVHPGGMEIAHVGDSRVYLVHSGAILQVTKDHSMVQEMVDRNLIKAEEAAKHPDANKIMRALGIAKDVEVDLRPDPTGYVAGDVVVLCSDGLSDLVDPSEILDIAGSRPAKQAAGQLVDLANARGGHDNITAMVIRMKGSASVHDSATVVKTIPLTAHEPTYASAGERAFAVAPAPRAWSEVQADRSRGPVLAGIVLAAIALGVVGTVIYVEQRPKHRDVRIVDANPGKPASPVPEADAAGETPPPDVTLAPVLAPPSGVKVPWWKDADASTSPSGENRDCAMARWQKEHGRPPSSYEALEAKCRAAGGKP